MDEAMAVSYLQRMRDILVTGWCQFDMGQDANGNYVMPFNPRACRWCLLGAATVATGTCSRHYLAVLAILHDALPAADRAVSDDPEQSLPFWNDSRDRKHADVLALIDAAIARVRTRAVTVHA